MQVNRNFL